MEQTIAASKPTRIRFRVVVFLFINVVINYMDRSNISVAATDISKDLKLSSVQLGYIFSAFGWTYALMQIPGGLLVDRFGPRLVYTFSLIAWSLVTLFQGFVKGFASLFGLRLATGFFEAPAYPANNRVVTSWFPVSERASAIAVYTSGQFICLAFLTPALVGLQYYIGWRGMFICTGSIRTAFVSTAQLNFGDWLRPHPFPMNRPGSTTRAARPRQHRHPPACSISGSSQHDVGLMFSLVICVSGLSSA